MPSLYMGPEVFRFQEIVIDRMVEPFITGNYVLGDKDQTGEFVPMWIGRSDTDLRLELKSKLSSGFPFFKFSVGPPNYSFELESAQYHGFLGKLQNKTHPNPPAGSGMKCVLCGYAGSG